MIPLTYQSFYTTRRKRFAERIHAVLRGYEQRDDFMEAMRKFKQGAERELKEAYDHRSISLEELLIGLTALAEVCLEAAYHFETEVMQVRYGVPVSTLHIIAMGKFGGCEMTLNSDLDLIFLFTDHGETTGPRILTYQEYFVRLVQRVISNLSLMTANRFVYKVDMKLRPSGRAGVLVSSWESFADYHRRDARLWEKQALLKGRAITADADARVAIANRLAGTIWDRDYPATIAAEIHELRMRMERELAKEEGDHYNIKVGVGGIVDIEFIVQYLQLRYGKDSPEVRSTHTLTVLRRLAVGSFLARSQAEVLEEAYLFYRSVETETRALQQRATELFPSNEAVGSQVARAVGERDFANLRKKYETFRHRVRQCYQEVLGIS